MRRLPKQRLFRGLMHGGMATRRDIPLIESKLRDDKVYHELNMLFSNERGHRWVNRIKHFGKWLYKHREAIMQILGIVIMFADNGDPYIVDKEEYEREQEAKNRPDNTPDDEPVEDFTEDEDGEKRNEETTDSEVDSNILSGGYNIGINETVRETSVAEHFWYGDKELAAKIADEKEQARQDERKAALDPPVTVSSDDDPDVIKYEVDEDNPKDGFYDMIANADKPDFKMEHAKRVEEETHRLVPENEMKTPHDLDWSPSREEVEAEIAESKSGDLKEAKSLAEEILDRLENDEIVDIDEVLKEETDAE